MKHSINQYKARVLAVACAAVITYPVAAQGPSFESTGNSLLQGTYYFRDVAYLVSDASGSLGRALAAYGNITFDGAGNYTINGMTNDSNAAKPVALTSSGTYSLSASGLGTMSSPIASGDLINIEVARGLLVGSATETTRGYNDMIVAAPVASTLPTASSFQGSYTIAGFLPGGSPVNGADVLFQVNPDGAGNLGTVSVPGFYGGGGTSILTQSSSGVKYFFSNGAAVVTFPNTSSSYYFNGQEYLYFSADGNLVFGGSPTGFDMLVGVKTGAAGTQKFSGLYYEAGLDQDTSTLYSYNYAALDTYYGSFNATNGAIVSADRLSSVSYGNTAACGGLFCKYGSTTTESYPTDSGNSYTTPGYFQYAVAAGGAIRIGAGIGPYLGINIAIQAPVLSGSGVYLNPAGVVNSASSAPFTAGISNGELITLYGTNLAPSATVSKTVPFPTTLAGVQVIINSVAAPIYYVSPTQISVIAPTGNPFPVAQIQVINNGQASNIVTEYVRTTTPGIFTQSATGLGDAAAVHNADGSLVTAGNPAQAGEYVQVFVTGLGAVYPLVADGAAAPAGQLSATTNTITASIGGVNATVSFAGLAPTLAGLYQVNILIPAGLAAGEQPLSISGPDSYTAQATIPIGSGTASVSAAARPALRSRP